MLLESSFHSIRLSGKGPEENRWFVINRLDGLDDGVAARGALYPVQFLPVGLRPASEGGSVALYQELFGAAHAAADAGTAVPAAPQLGAGQA